MTSTSSIPTGSGVRQDPPGSWVVNSVTGATIPKSITLNGTTYPVNSRGEVAPDKYGDSTIGQYVPSSVNTAEAIAARAATS